jgi:zinc finger CCCH domain-containing protein 13
MNSAQNNIPERRTTKKSGSGFSLWSRKSLKRSNTAHSISPLTTNNDVTSQAASDDLLNTPHNGFQRQNSFQSSILSHPRRDMSPSAGEPVTWTTVPVAATRVQYNIHNPLGPRWYKNYHLIPPSENRPGARPPTFFSPSFPGISTSNVAHPGDAENSSRAASKSPLPTPASSQTRVNEGVKPRSRKTSQTTPDNVDMLDVTDPWGTNWHHESPYDVGQASIAPDVSLSSATPFNRLNALIRVSVPVFEGQA